MRLDEMGLGKSEQQMRNKMGLRTESWGTPENTSGWAEKVVPTLTEKVASDIPSDPF